MATLEQQLADAIRAQNELTQAVAAKMGQIDAKVAEKAAQIDAYLAVARGEYPMPPNMLNNSYMTNVSATTGIPVGYSAVGCTISAVSPYTKGFEGIYTEGKPEYAVTDPEMATSIAPMWYGVYNKGPRLFRGGLADGWGGSDSGKILKITAQASATPASRMVYFAPARYAATNKIGFRCFVKVVRGASGCSFGTDAGYIGTHRGFQVTKAMSDASSQGWYFADFIIDTSQVTVPIANSNFSMGFSSDEEVEVYLALPYCYVPYGARPGIVNN